MKIILTTLLGAFFMLSIVTACQTAAPVSVSKIPAADDSKPAAETAEAHADDDAPRITLAEAKQDFDADAAIFVDTRDAGSYNISHIKGAINISAADLKEKIKTIPANKKIIAYCS